VKPAERGEIVRHRLEQTWYVLEFRPGEEAFHRAGAGATVFVPPRVAHAFANGTETARSSF
jgi:hypothetical protein